MTTYFIRWYVGKRLKERKFEAENDAAAIARWPQLVDSNIANDKIFLSKREWKPVQKPIDPFPRNTEEETL